MGISIRRLAREDRVFTPDEVIQVLAGVQPAHRGDPLADVTRLARLNTIVAAQFDAASRTGG